ncbi:MAG: endonuclease/exonuclease/phosphatase family protein [Cytophagaceae bacterium]
MKISKIRLWYTILFLAISIKPLSKTFTFTPRSIDTENSYSITSYNVRVFNVYDHLKDANYESSKGMIDWIIRNNSDVICIQEFYNSNTFPFLTIKSLHQYYPYYHFEPFLSTNNQAFGMVIFSKFPIKNNGYLQLKGNTNNQILFSDIIFPEKTIRVYNMHLQSMAIDPGELKEGFIEKGFIEKVKDAAIKYKYGSEMRVRQVSKLISHMKNSPYPTIIAGDLNDLPYSYIYKKLDMTLQNAFEQCGNGIGFTYADGPLMLRIDNIFLDKNFSISEFEVYEHVKYSDHYPISAKFKLK